MEKENLPKEQVFKGEVNGVEVCGKTYKEFTLNYLAELVNQYKNLPDKKRIKAYVDYFVKNLNYDKKHRDNILAHNHKETHESNEKELFTLLHDGHGVCRQFSQALTLISVLDKKITNSNYFKAAYASCTISQKGQKMGHAINLCNVGDEVLVIDISSMIHARDKNYALDSGSFGFVPVEEYIANLKQIDTKILSAVPRSGERYLACYIIKLDPDLMYSILNLTTDELNDPKNSELNRLVVYKYNLPNPNIVSI